MDKRVEQLVKGFSRYVRAFADRELFTGPSLFFHLKTVKIRKRHGSAVAALRDDEFLDALYATLTAWGMHRMGSSGAKLAEFADIKHRFRKQEKRIAAIESLRLATLRADEVAAVAEELWKIMYELKVSTSETQIVAGSKALHHLLPDLVPPIDRQYTLRFFYGNSTNVGQKDQEGRFKEIFPRFCHIGASQIDRFAQWIGSGMNSSETKIIDNAIVEYVSTKIKTGNDNLT